MSDRLNGTTPQPEESSLENISASEGSSLENISASESSSREDIAAFESWSMEERNREDGDNTQRCSLRLYTFVNNITV